MTENRKSKSSTLYKKAATKAPTPRAAPPRARMVAAAPSALVLVADELSTGLPSASVADGRGPVLEASDALLATTPTVLMTVAFKSLLTETTMDCVELTPAVPMTGMVWMPLPRAGSEAAAFCDVTTEGCSGMDVTAAGCVVMAAGCVVTAGGCPVTTPRELVWVM